ncbi:hypothetical protein [Rhizobium sp. RAF56]|uniref:hypothetical protein n=1 Tax=Rhizobium sp. RAF56 TaxID=3233062 RepID=UPI003F944272
MKDVALKKMVTPDVKRDAVAHACKQHRVSQRRACEVLSIDRSSVRYLSVRPDDADIREAMKAVASNDDGEKVPIGIMNAKQPLSLPEDMDVSVSHPDHDLGPTDEFIGRDELRTLTEPWIEPVRIIFPHPSVNTLLSVWMRRRPRLEEIMASAIEAGWATREVAIALIAAANSLNHANGADPDPADDPNLIDARKVSSHNALVADIRSE